MSNFEHIQFNNGLYTIHKSMPFKVRTAKETCEEDWKTAIVHEIPPIPANTDLTVKRVFLNLYDRILEVDYNGRSYSISAENCDFIGLGE